MSVFAFIRDDEGTGVLVDAIQAFWQSARHDDWTVVQLRNGTRIEMKTPVAEIHACLQVWAEQ